MTDTSKEAVELLPCPFCGKEAKRHTCMGNRLRKGPPWYETKYRVSCSESCACSSKPCDTQAEADADWNTRPAISPAHAAKVLAGPAFNKGVFEDGFEAAFLHRAPESEHNYKEPHLRHLKRVWLAGYLDGLRAIAEQEQGE